MNQRPRFCPQCGTALSLQPRDGRRRPVCSACGFIYYVNPVPSIAAILFREGRVCLVKRNIEPGLGLWSLPGGFIEEDETVEDAVVREVEEETGLCCKPLHLVDMHTMISAYYGSILVLCFLTDVIRGNLKAGGDADDVRFFDLNNIPEIAFDVHLRFLEKHVGHSIPVTSG